MSDPYQAAAAEEVPRLRQRIAELEDANEQLLLLTLEYRLVLQRIHGLTAKDYEPPEDTNPSRRPKITGYGYGYGDGNGGADG